MIRSFDLIFSVLGLILLFPFFLLISVIICIESKGSTFFIQTRVGLYGKHFKIFKFMTMKKPITADLNLTLSTNKRLTKFGAFLRNTKMDELPQLINVIKGEMSIVGPRPEVPEYVKYYTIEQRKILSVLPGITDIASIKFLDESKILSNYDDPEKYYIEYLVPQKIQLNMEFIENRTVKNYFKIIIETIKHIL